ncbi:hypothetical protein HDV00_009562 [Rhizophlyctis rosea]|nr:hypothetical protein HDV00_009562 [Rhizophlyctis rosea]
MSLNQVDPGSSYLNEEKQPFTEQPAAVKQMNLQPSYANTIKIDKAEHGFYEGCITSIGAFLGTIGMIPCCCCCNPYQTVQQGEVGLITYFGKYYRAVDPGLYRVNIVSEKMKRVNIMLQVQDIPQQYIMTKDNVNITIDSVVYWHIVDPYVAQFLVQNVSLALVDRTQTTLRHILGNRNLQDIIENRETLSHEIQEIIGETAESWGIRVENILIKDLGFSQELQQTLAAAAKAKRVGESKVIAAQAEVEAAKLMREASDILNTPAAMQIRYLETLTSMSKQSGTKVIFMPPASSSLSGGGGDKGKGPSYAMTAMDGNNWEQLADKH